jgi:FkbM family methyltransferase
MEKYSLERIYSHLGDEESRFWFEKRLCYSLTGDMQRLVCAIKNKMEIRKTGKDFFLFGAGPGVYGLVNAYPEISWRAIIDNDELKVGKPNILPVISFKEFMKNSKNAVVFIKSPLYGNEMRQQLISNSFPENSIIQFYGVQYFDLPYFKPLENEFYIDAGGFDGSSTKCFFQWLQNKTGRSVIFEPNSICYEDCRNNIKKWNYSNVEVVNKGLWHKKETLRFCKSGSASSISMDGEEIIETVSLDEYLETEKETKIPTFIKMDIEGTELNALKGAEQTIRKHKPKLAISIYHKPEDIWEISNLLLDFVPDYKFYIRHYSFDHFETVLYALSSS